MNIMNKIANTLIELVTLIILFNLIFHSIDALRPLHELNNALVERTVIGDINVTSDSRVRLRHNHSVKIHRRCRRFAQTFYKPYQHIDSYRYVYPYQPYIVPTCTGNKCGVYCLRCPTCCPRPCPFPTPATIRTSYRPYRTSKRTTAVPRTSVTPKTTSTKKGASPFASIIIKTSLSCNCNPDGSKFTMCNVTSGQCVCKEHFTGKTCDICENGYWKNNQTCERCHCNEYGSIESDYCDQVTGKCFCKGGVTGYHCDSCLPGYYGAIKTGCKKCDPCQKKGHICDPHTGKCVCPPLTTGKDCNSCAINAWGFKPELGCTDCICSAFGSLSLQCDLHTGNCNCKEGYQGLKCGECSFGYYGYPNCRKCVCDPRGTEESDCSKDLCKCSSDGSCNCKKNVQGKHCDICKSSYFGLSDKNVLGCTGCTCFNRSTICENAQLNWDKIRKDKFSPDTNSIEEIEDILMLPRNFLGDLTTSYGGYLTVDVSGELFDVYLEGNGIVLHQLSRNTEIQMIESSGWRTISGNSLFPQKCVRDLSRTCFMAILQNVTKIRIEAKTRIQEVLLDRAKSNIPNYPATHAIEKCKCPVEYTGLSCQNPNDGYFRHFPQGEKHNWIDKVIGIAKPCECNRKSTQCDPNTGHCKNCSDHTSGNNCELCIEGYYKDTNNDCSPCLCPSRDQNNAESCKPIKGKFKCICKKGYRGVHCEQCDTNFFSNGRYCESCNCNPFGTLLGSNCLNGICQCKEGFKGKKCDRCINERQFIKNGLCSACDECTLILFNEIDQLSNTLETTSILFGNYSTSSSSLLNDNINDYKRLHKKYQSIERKVGDLLKKPNIVNLDKQIKDIQGKISSSNGMAEENILKTDKLYDKSGHVMNDSKNLNRELTKLINDINNFGNANISLEEALNKAEESQREIRYLSDAMTRLQDNRVYNLCSQIQKQINSIYAYSPSIPNKNLEDIENMVEDLMNINVIIEADLKRADFLNRNNSERIKELKEKIQLLNDKNELSNSEVEHVLEKIRATNDVLEQLETVYEHLVKISKSDEINILEKKFKREMVKLPEIEEMFLKSIEHVQELENRINNYSSMFNFTKDEWQKINASGAYDSIINGIKEVRHRIKFTEETLKHAVKIITPDDYDDITDKANLAYAYSDRLKKRINNFRSISKDLNLIRNKLNDLKYAILANGKANNELTQVLHKMETDITSQKDRVIELENVIVDSMEVSNGMRKIEKEIENTQFDKEHIFFKEYQEFFNLTSPEEINNLSNTLRLGRKKLQSLNISSTYMNSLENLNKGNNQNSLGLLKSKLRNLHKKIDYARQAADTVNVPLSLANCSMLYKVSKREYFRSISIIFKCQDCNLFSWKKNSGSLFQIRHENQRLGLKIGEKEVSVKTSINKGNEITITINRIGARVKLLVNGKEGKSFKIDSDFNIMDLDDNIAVGSSNESKTTGYIYQIFLNEKNFGLWNFRNTTGSCKGQKRDKTEIPDSDLRQFFADGAYRVYDINKQFVPRKVSLSFDINTFDENSLIYLATTEYCQQYITLYLEGGFAKFTVLHGKDIVNTQISDKKLNNGENYGIEITTNYEERSPKEGEQQYNLIVRFKELAIENKSNRIALNSSELVKIRRAQHYLGGVPPTFNRSCLPLSTNSFLGFLKAVTPLTNENASYGISSVSNKVLEFSYAWVNTNGSITLNTQKKPIISLSFILKPSDPNGIVLKLNENQKLYLENSKILITNLQFPDTNEDTYLKLNDYNDIQLSLDKEKYISINGKELPIPNGTSVTMEDTIQIGDFFNGFTGGIREIIINDELLLFNSSSLASFSNVDIGRDKETNIFHSSYNVKSLTLNPNFTNYMQNTEGCANFENYEIEDEAVKFGDKTNSYVVVRKNFWKNDYLLELDFRTFYPNGLILFSSGYKQQSYIALEVREGKLHLIIKGKRKDIPVMFNKKVNDGRWHNVKLNKRKRKLIITLDMTIKKPVRVPKTNVKNEIYFGGVPQASELHKSRDLKDKLRPFHGCMRSLFLNEEPKFLEEKRNEKDITFSNTGQCFADIEEGAYFAGDGYAIYDENYIMSDILELSFEFRTAEQNGIILTISESRNSPAFSVELQNGALVMAVDVGNGEIRYASNNLDSDFALCNNQWHTVKTLYSNSELTVIVNGIRKTWVQPVSNSMFEEYEAPLYIGGIPGNGPTGTLKSRDNFKGCIKKLRIANIPLSWSDMNELNNVSVNACPSHSTSKK